MTTFPAVIKTEEQYDAALARIEEIIFAEPESETECELELLALLIKVYEDEKYPIDAPDPVTAIRFRMEQAGLKPKDLIPYIGSQSKVSEVLSGRRPLSSSMMRNLHKGLGIPAEVLIQKASPQEAIEKTWEQHGLPIAEMTKRGWFPGFHGDWRQAKQEKEELLATFFAPALSAGVQPQMTLNRQMMRSGSTCNQGALLAWRIRVITLALREALPRYEPRSVNEELLDHLAHLSYLDEGPRLAKEFLAKVGISLIIEQHLPGTHLDGAALKLPDGSPVVALTLRHDRLDNFWFTLFHELAHVALHLDRDGVEGFFDNLDVSSTQTHEREADEMACNCLIPVELWRKSGLNESSTHEQIRQFAKTLHISPAIPAGRIRKSTGNYRHFSRLIGQGKVREQFVSS